MMKTLITLFLLSFFCFNSMSQTIPNNNSCDMNVIFYCSKLIPIGCGDNCTTPVCVTAGGGTASVPTYADCSADCDEYDYVEICPSDIGTSCVDCGTPSCFTYDYETPCIGGLPYSTNFSFTGCPCGTIINVNVTGSGDFDIN